jgi:xanthine dehydrogenase accessory factor
MSLDQLQWPKLVSEFVESGEPFVLVTLIEILGSAPQSIGAKAVIKASGLAAGTVGGGKVEARAITYAQELLNKKDAIRCQTVKWNLTKDVGMTCGGVVTLLFETFISNRLSVVVFGAGHVAQELVPMLCKLEANVTSIDDRKEWIDKISDHPHLKKILSPDMASEVQKLPTNAFYILMTKGHATDMPILKEILNRSTMPPFLGVIGSHTKATIIRANLMEMGFGPDKINLIHCPVGLPFGNNSPVEISFSIVAQVIQMRDQLQKLNVTKSNLSSINEDTPTKEGL